MVADWFDTGGDLVPRRGGHGPGVDLPAGADPQDRLLGRLRPRSRLDPARLTSTADRPAIRHGRQGPGTRRGQAALKAVAWVGW